MKKNRLLFLTMFVASFACNALFAQTTYPDFALNFTDNSFLTAEETSEQGNAVLTGVTFDASGTPTRVASDDESATLVLNTKYWNDHGLNGFGTTTFKVSGTTKIEVGICQYSSNAITVKDAGGNAIALRAANGTDVTEFNNNGGNCFKGDNSSIVAVYYTGEAATLTISGGSYVPYFAVSACTADDVPASTTVYSITYQGIDGVSGVLPASQEVASGESFTVPANFTLYKEGATLTGWNDGTTTYATGETVSPTADLTLTPVYTDNTVALADRTQALTVKWDFQRQNGAPTVSLQGTGNTGYWVAPAAINATTTIDLGMKYDATNGKIANGNWTDWAQLNSGTIFTVPVVNGSVITIEAYSTITTTTIDGGTDYTQGTTISYTYIGMGTQIDEVEIVIGDGSYYRYIQVTYPFIQGTEGEKFENDTVTATWSFDTGTNAPVEATVDVEKAFTVTEYTIGSHLTCTGTQAANDGITFSKYQPEAQVSGVTDGYELAFSVKPSAGLTFTPTHVSFQACRFGTDGGALEVIATLGDGTTKTLASGIKPARNNVDPFSSAFSYDITDVEAIEGAFILKIYINSLGNNKQIGFCNIVLKGVMNGTLLEVNKYTIEAVASDKAAGTVSIKPKSTLFDEGTTISVSADKNFGYNFVNWTDESGTVLSSENPYTFEATADAKIIGVFEAINTYELKVNVDGDANDYMISYSPAYTEVGGKKMYEEGTTVAITASNNPIITFNNWSTSETTMDKSFVMNQDHEVTAYFSNVDYIVGWDFYATGNGGRVADFASEAENDASSLILRLADGTTVNWLDKSQLAAGGYEGAPAAVNWKPLADKYYYQISFDATNFTDIMVQSSMLYNYNAYSVQKVEYSLDGENWTEIGQVELNAAKTWYKTTFALGSDANNQSKVYIRWIPNYESTVAGTESDNDGTAISAIYVTGTAAIFDDGTAPVLVSTIPADAATGASATGKIILTFDEKVQIKANTVGKLGDVELVPTVSGKTIAFPYTGLEYSSNYIFTLPSAVVSDLSGNTLEEGITISFATMVRPTVTKKAYDFVVGVDGDFKAAVAAAQAASASGERFYIFFPDGEYNLGELTGDDNQMTTISLANVSYIGQSTTNTVLFNQSINESINSTATLYLTDAADGVYMQDMSLLNKMDYRTGTLLGRGVALWNKGEKNIFKNVALLSNQDTYYTGGGRTYWENGEIHGTVDFICGGGDIFFNQVLLYLEERSGNCLTAPATAAGGWGYVFSNCTIDGFAINKGAYRLGRPWSNEPKSIFINTTMKVLPTSDAWGDPMNVVPKLFAEYNSMTESGTAVDLSTRRTSYTKDSISVTLNPVLTASEAAAYTVDNVLGGEDNWQPQLYTEQSAKPVLTGDGRQLSWNNSDYVLCWTVFKNGIYQACVTTNYYTVPEDTEDGALFTVCAANEMGGLSEASDAYTYSLVAVTPIPKKVSVISQSYYNITGAAVAAPAKGIYIVRSVLSDGTVKVGKVFIK